MKSLIKSILILSVIMVSCNAGISFGQNNFWESTGGPLGGCIRDFSMNSRGTMIISATDGISVSTDHGKSWKHRGKFSPNFGAAPVLVIAENDDIIATEGNGLFKSTDYGQSWMKVTDTMPGNWAIAFVMNAQRILFAAFSGPLKGVYRSFDDGINWELTSEQTAKLYIKILTKNSRGDLFAAATDTSGVWRSTDNGATWTKISSIPWINAVCFNQSDDIFLRTDRDYNGSGLFRSTDNGISWAPLRSNSNSKYVCPPALAIDSKGNVVFAILSDNSVDENHIVRSTDNGDTWTRIGQHELKHQHFTKLFFNLNDDLFVGTCTGSGGCGVFVQRESDTSWIQFGTHPIEQIRQISVTKKDEVLTGSHLGMFLSTDEGDTWEYLMNSPACYLEVGNQIVTTDDGTIIVCPGTYRSPDRGKTWEKLEPGFLCYSMDISESGKLYAVSDSVFYTSTDNGDTWSRTSFFLTPAYVNISLKTGQDGEIFILRDTIFYRSTDDGRTWSSLTTPAYFRLFAVGPNGILCGATSSNGIAVSTDHGSDWSVNVNDMFRDVLSIVIDRNSVLYISTASSVLISTDIGTTWKERNDGLDVPWMKPLAANSKNRLFAGTMRSGVFRSTSPVSSIRDIGPPATCSLMQNFPNPFSSSTIIRFDTRSSLSWADRTSVGQVLCSLKAYDLLGRVVATLVDGELELNVHEIRFDAANLPDGVYLLVLRIGGNSEVRYMTLMR